SPFPRPIGPNCFQTNGPYGGQIWLEFPMWREGPRQVWELCGMPSVHIWASHIVHLGFPLLMWDLPGGHVTGPKEIAILRAFLHILGCKWVNLKALACLSLCVGHVQPCIWSVWAPSAQYEWGAQSRPDILLYKAPTLGIDVQYRLAHSLILTIILPFKLRFWEIKTEALEALGPDPWKRSINGTSSGLLAP
ncbi:hypothetical protein B0H14DRAFT_2617043, partial [Mycena olivaceomarginata]